MLESWLASLWPERDAGSSVELGNSFGVVCAFYLHSIFSVSTTGWHFVSYTTLIIDKGASKRPSQFREKTPNIQRIVNVTWKMS
jgi:hypothetical protein